MRIEGGIMKRRVSIEGFARGMALLGVVAILACGCTSTGATGGTGATAPEPAGDPARGAVPLPAAGGWNAFLVLDNGTTGIWTVKAFPIFDHTATPEVVGLDDAGRCHVVVSYSGKWTPIALIDDSKWLGGLAHGDVDPRIPGGELYTGGQGGNLYQVAAYPQGALDARLIAYLPGREIHTIVAGDVDLAHPGRELLVFTHPGGVYRIAPTGPDGTFETRKIRDLGGRIRDAVVLPGGAGKAPGIATVSRDGRFDLYRFTPEGVAVETVHSESMGMGRIAMRKGDPSVLYTTLDDGRVLRHERLSGGGWNTETIYIGPEGPRGIVSGRFHVDPEIESVAVFGYGGRVDLLAREGDGWRVETIFTDRDRGHWLAAAEIDGRNVTDEILGSGYGGRIFLLTRPPGFGFDEGVPIAPETR
jgi:hypothetical protein